MCGIAGILAYHYAAGSVDDAELQRMNARMKARGPDGSGLWLDEHRRIGLAHRRLAIIDLSDAGAQPMVSADGRFVVTFNGEIYNFRELRANLEKEGRHFLTGTDTEVLLHLYAQLGPGMVHALRGMFAFAIWDTVDSTLFLARDPFGIKPLYYADDGWTFRFASQVKALLAGGRLSHDPEPAGVVGFYLWGHVPEPFTTYQAVRALPAGTCMLVDRTGAGAPRRYHSIADVYCRAEAAAAGRMTDADVAAEARAAFLDSVRHHLVSDVPVGAFLSAGIDSSALVGLMRDAGQTHIKSVTIGFREFVGGAEDEAPLAADVARRYATEHTTRIVGEAEFVADLPLILDAMDQPSIDGINTWFVAKAARELGVKVAISGLGGDELLAGYPSFKDIPRWVRWARHTALLPGFGKAARRLLAPLPKVSAVSPKAAGLLELGTTYPGAYLLRRGLFMPWELARVVGADVAREGLSRLDPMRQMEASLAPMPRSVRARIAILESAFYMRNQTLRDTDWASMAHSLEVRVPLVDSTLVDRIARLQAHAPHPIGKTTLANAPLTPLPTAVSSRAKTGFSTPIGNWMTSATRRVPLRSRETVTSKGAVSREWGQLVAVRHRTSAGSATPA